MRRAVFLMLLHCRSVWAAGSKRVSVTKASDGVVEPL
jgi:hypothetical protein